MPLTLNSLKLKLDTKTIFGGIFNSQCLPVLSWGFNRFLGGTRKRSPNT